MSTSTSTPTQKESSTIRIAHFSDTHVLALDGVSWQSFLNKRISGAVNLALNRAKHYRVDVFEHLLDHIVSLSPDHSVCTGDLVNLALVPEFEKVKILLDQRFSKDQLTLVPGNHDYYTKESAEAQRFESTFADFLPQQLLSFDTPYPISRSLSLKGQLIHILGLSSAKVTPIFSARGEIGDPQIAKLKQLLSLPESASAFQLLMLHHPLFPSPERKLETTRKLEDAQSILNLFFNEPQLQPNLIIHGHNHMFKNTPLYAFEQQKLSTTIPQPKNPPVVQVASASRFKQPNPHDHVRKPGDVAEFHMYVIENQQLIRIERHIYMPHLDQFVACDENGLRLA